MDSYYALGATSVPMRKSRLVTAIRFSMCLHYNRFRMRKQATQPKHFHIFSTNSKFSQSITTFSQPIFFLYSLFTPSHHQNPPKPSREKGKSIAVISRKKSRSERQLPVNQIGSLNFQRYFLPLDGGGGVLIQSVKTQYYYCNMCFKNNKNIPKLNGYTLKCILIKNFLRIKGL